jgi:hypothetical protein
MLQPDPTGVGTYVKVPRDVASALALRGQPKIRAVIAGHPYRGSLRAMGDGAFGLGVLKAIQRTAGVQRGDTIDVDLELDTAPRVIEPPSDLAAVLRSDKKAAAGWERQSHTNKREIARSLEEARRSETRERRLIAALAKLRS